MAVAETTLDLPRLRERLDALVQRRDELAERIAVSAPSHRALETMQFELAAAAWRLAELEQLN